MVDPVRLVGIHQGAQYLYDRTDVALANPVSLRVESGRHEEANPQESMDLAPELGGELGVTVRENLVRDAMKPHYFFEEKCGESRGSYGSLNGDEMDHRGEATDDNPKVVKVARPRERSDEVHCDGAPGSSGERETVEETKRRSRPQTWYREKTGEDVRIVSA